MVPWAIGYLGAVMLIADPPPEVPGFALFRVCAVGSAGPPPRTTEWLYIRPSAVIAVTNPVELQDTCSAIYTISGNRLYVHGTDTEVSSKLRADRE